MKKTVPLLSLFLSAGFSLSASLIPIGLVPSSGAGLGAVNTLLTFQSNTTGSGCVSAGVGGGELTGSGSCPAGFAGGDEQAINNVYSLSSLGITTAGNLQIIVNASEPGNAAQRSITFESIAVTLWDGDDGSILGAFYTADPFTITDPPQGVGQAGYGFVLDTTQASNFNAIAAAFPDAYLGAAATASDTAGGLETISVRAVEAVSPIPEPGTWLLLSGAIPALLLIRRKVA